MPITLDQARALDAVARHGTFEAAARAIAKAKHLPYKGHTAVAYALRTMEAALGLTLLDREGYRTRLTPAGETVLPEARALLASAVALEATCAELRSGWEPRLRVVVDGIFPIDPILRAVQALALQHAKTRIAVSTAFLGGVEQAFAEGEADMMIAVVPVTTTAVRVVRLAPVAAMLVAHRRHPLAQLQAPANPSQLAAHVLLTVRGSDPRLRLSTSALAPSFVIELNDFAAKKAAIMSRLGFGWLPNHLIEKEIASGELVVLGWTGASQHQFEPRLYARAGTKPGASSRALIERLRAWS